MAALQLGLTPDRVEWHLWNWEQWQHHCRIPGRLSNRASGGIEGYTGYDGDCTEAYEESDRVAAAAVQALLDGMVPWLRLSVYVKHGITAVYRLRGDVEVAYCQACVSIGVGMARRGFC